MKKTVESNAHQEMIVTTPEKPGSNKHKIYRALFDTRASGSLTAPEILDKDLKVHVKNSTKKSKRKIGMGEFVSEGTVKVNKAAFSSFAT